MYILYLFLQINFQLTTKQDFTFFIFPLDRIIYVIKLHSLKAAIKKVKEEEGGEGGANSAPKKGGKMAEGTVNNTSTSFSNWFTTSNATEEGLMGGLLQLSNM